MALCLSPEVAAQVRYRGQFPEATLEPIALDDGRYAVNADTLTDRKHALYRPLLTTGTVEDDGSLTFEDSTVIHMTLDSKDVYLSAFQAAHAFDIPAPHTYRFECRYNESGYSGDAANGNRRSELVSGDDGNRYGAGETLWCAFSFVVGPEHVGFDSGGPLNLIHQWHSVDVDVSRPPVLGVSLTSGNLDIYTRSDATGSTSQARYSAARPVDGVVHHIVIAGLLGSSGHLDVWLDGSQIVDADIPIGYYNDDEGERDLAYPHWGLYQNNIGTPTVVFCSNLEWGVVDLSARIASPATVNVPPAGWI